MNSLNLKKKIAFISSLAMLAATAAYLPADIAKQVGFGSSIVEAAASALTPADATAQTFKLYVKVDGKYLPKTASDGLLTEFDDTTCYSLTNAEIFENEYVGKNVTVEEVTGTWSSNSAFSEGSGEDTATKTTTTYKKDEFGKTITGSKIVYTGTYQGAAATKIENTLTGFDTNRDNYDVLAVKENAKINLNAYEFIKPDSVVEIVVVPDKTTYTVGCELASGSAKSFPVKFDEHGMGKIAANSDKIVSASDNSDFNKNSDGTITAATGKYEVADLSGLQIVIDDETAQAVSGFSKATSGIAVSSDEANTFATNTSVKGEEVYAYTKVGDVYAINTNITLSTPVAPNASIEVELNPKVNWTVAGEGVSNKKLKLVMGSDNKAKSGLITYTKSSGEKEYYIVNIINEPATFNGSLNITMTDSDTTAADNFFGNTGSAVKITSPTSAANSYKVSKEVVAKTVKDGSKQFVNVYTIATNSTDKDKHTIAVAGGDGSPDISVEETVSSSIYDDGNFYVENCKGTSPILKAGTVYFQLVVTNEYEIEADPANAIDDEDVVTKVKVVGKEITQPTDPKKAGYTFKSWKNTNSEDVFVANNSIQQAGVRVNPNESLTATYDANNYNVVFDSNGGEWSSQGAGFVASSVVDKKIVQISRTTNSNADIATDIVLDETASTLNNENLERSGYELLGWSTDKNATKPMTKQEYAAARPAEPYGTVTLYAVWEVKKTAVDFDTFKFVNGVQKAGTDIADYSAYETDMSFKGENGNVAEANLDYKVEVGKTYGELPTPVLPGYTFAGWYKKVQTTDADGKTSYTAVKVTSASKVMQNDVAADGDITLYAKFKQDTYKITYDLDGGEFAKDAKPAVTIKYEATDAQRDNDSLASTATAYNEDKVDYYVANESAVVEPTKGSGYFVFDGWTVTDGTKTETIAKNTDLKAITLTSNVTVKANWKVSSGNSAKSSIALNTNGGDFYNVTERGENLDLYNRVKSGFAGFIANEKTDVIANGVRSVDGDIVTCVLPSGANTLVLDNNAGNETQVSPNGVDSYTFIVSRAGYTFTGWYSDKECTKPYSFTKFPEKETEVTVYAGWKANTATRYKMEYELIDEDGAVVDPSLAGTSKTYMGVTDEEVSAVDKTITITDGNTKRKFVFDAKRSTGLKFTDKVKAEYYAGKDGSTAGKLDSGDEYGLLLGKFVEDESKQTVIKGVFIEQTAAPTELGTVNDTIVDSTGRVTWSPVDNAIEYKVVKKVGEKTYYTDKIKTTEYQFGSVPETEYSVRVVAFDKDGNKTWGKEVTVAGPVDPFELGEIKNVKVAADRQTVTWDKVDNAVTYKVAKKVGDKTYYTSEVSTNSIKFASATQGEFSVSVIAINENGDKKWSDDVKVEAVKSNLGAAGNVKVGTDNKTLTWSAVDNAVSYRVAKIVGGKTYYTAKTTKLTTTLGSALKEGNKVYLIAYDKNGKSVTGPQTKISPVAKATKVAVAADGKTVTWTAAKNAAKYQVAKLINGKTYYGTKVDAKTTKYTFGSAATAGTQVFVITFDADGNSSYSDAVLVK